MKYSFLDIKQSGMKDSYIFSARVFLGIPGNILLWFIANFTFLTPNTITFISLLLMGLSAISFLYGFFLIGAIVFYFAFILDWVDGALARLTKNTSSLGALYDYFGDTMAVLSIGITISLYLYKTTSEISYIFIGFSYLIICLLLQALYSTSYKLNKGELLIKKIKDDKKMALLMRARQVLQKRKIRMSYSQTDTNFIAFFFAPIFALIFRNISIMKYGFLIATLMLVFLYIVFFILQIRVLKKEFV